MYANQKHKQVLSAWIREKSSLYFELNLSGMFAYGGKLMIGVWVESLFSFARSRCDNQEFYNLFPRELNKSALSRSREKFFGTFFQFSHFWQSNFKL